MQHENEKKQKEKSKKEAEVSFCPSPVRLTGYHFIFLKPSGFWNNFFKATGFLEQSY